MKDNYFIPRVRVQGTLKKSQYIEYDKYQVTYKDKPKIIPCDRLEFLSLTLMEAVLAIKPDEFETLTITYSGHTN